MKYLLDTNAVIALLNRQPDFTAKLKRHRPADFVLPSVVAFELYYGAYKSRKTEENLAKIAKLPFALLPFDAEDAQAAGQIRAALARKGMPIGVYDTLIAAQAVARNLVLVTHNIREFSRVEGLEWEDWL